MPSPTTPMHGKLCAIYHLRPNGFEGDGLNDATWGTAYSGASSRYYDVEIMTEGTPDKYKWRKDGGAWDDNGAAGYNITGAAQTLDDGQTITFAATTGHTAGDRWSIGNLKDEACTESGTEAQITASAKRILNPNATPTFTDTGSKNVLIVDHTRGKAVFDDNVTVVTVTGNNGYVPLSALEEVGYLVDWSFQASLELAAIPKAGDQWQTHIPGHAGGKGGAGGYFIGGDSFFDAFEDNADGTQKYFFLELYNYDPDQDQTGDHFNVWVTFDSFAVNPSINQVVKEAVSFQLHGIPSFTANA